MGSAADFNQAFFQALYQNAADAIFVADAQTGMLLDANPRALLLSGHSMSEIRSMHQSELHPADDVENSKKRFKTAAQSGPDLLLEMPLIRADGTRIPVQISTGDFTDQNGRSCQFEIFRDLRDLRRKDELQRLERERYQAFIANSTEGIWRFEVEGGLNVETPPEEAAEYLFKNARLAECNSAFARMYGYDSPAEMTGFPLSKILPPTDPANLEILIAFARSGYRLTQKESNEIGRDGQPLHFLNNVSGVIENGRVVRFWGTQTDISARVNAETALRESEEKLRTVFDNSNDVLSLIDRDGFQTFISPVVTELTGYTPEELARPFPEVIHPDDLPRVLDAWKSLMDNPGPAFRVRYRHIHKTRQWVWFEAVARNHLANPAIGMVVVNVRDITDLIAAEESARQNEEKLSAILKNTSDVLLLLDREGNQQYLSEVSEELTGYAGDEMKGHFGRHIHPEDLPRVNAMWMRILERPGLTDTVAYRHNHPQKGWIWLEAKASNCLHVPSLASVVVSVRDINERKKAEDALRASEEKLRLIIGNSSDLVLLVDREGRQSFLSGDSEAVTGFTRDELTGPFQKWIHPEDLPAMHESFGICLQNPGKVQRIRYRNRHKTREWVWLEATAVNYLHIPAISAVVVNVRDIDEARRSENALRESEERFREVVGNINVGIFMSTLDGRFLFLNDRIAEMAGFANPAEMKQTPAGALYLKPEDRSKMLEDLMREGSVRNRETISVRKDRSRYPVSINATLQCDPDGKPASLIGAIEDISERKAAEEALRNSERMFRESMKFLPVPIGISRQDGTILYLNECFIKTFGYDQSDMPSLQAWSVLAYPDPSYRDFAMAQWKRDLEAALTENRTPTPRIYQVRCKDSSEKQIELSVQAIGDFLIASFFDLTLSIRKEDELRQSEEKFRLLVNHVGVGIYMTRLDGSFLFVNETLLRIGGYESAEEMMRIPASALYFDPSAREIFIQEIREKGVVSNREVLCIRKDGTPVNVLTSASFLKNSQGNPECIIGSMEDITDRRKAEQKLRESEARYRRFIETTLDGFGIIDREGRIVEVNPRMEELFGYGPGEMTGMNVVDTFAPPESREEYRAEIEKRKTGKTSVYEQQFARKDGVRIWLRASATPIFSDKGYEGSFAMFTDISEQKRMEQGIRESELRFRSVLEASPMGLHLYELMPDGRLVFTGANPAADRLLRTDHQQSIGKTIQEAFPPLAGTEIPDRYRKVASTGESWQNEHLEFQDDRIQSAYEIHAFQTLPGRMAVFFLDISARRRAEEKIRESEKRLRDLYDNMLDGYVKVNMEGRIIECNRAFREMLGYTPEEIVLLRYQDITPENWHAREAEVVEKQIMKRGHSEIFRKEYRRKDGSIFPVELLTILSRDDTGNPSAMWAIVRDVSEKTKAEESLREREQIFRDAIEFLPVPISISLCDGAILLFNRMFRQTFGYTLSDLTNLEQWFLHAYPNPEYRAEAFEIWKAELEAAKVEKRATTARNYQVTGMDGSLHEVEISSMQTGDIVITSFLDLTEKRKTEESLLAAFQETEKANQRYLCLNQDLERKVSEKIEEIRVKDQILNVQARQALMGEMLGNIAHQWRQPLTALALVLQNYKTYWNYGKLDETVIKNAEEKGMRLVEHMSHTIDDFRHFFRPDKERQRFSARVVFENTLALVEGGMKNNMITLEADIPENIFLFGFPNEYGQVMLNVLNNARDILVERAIAEPRIFCRLLEEGEFAVMTVSDNGGGIPPEILPKIGTPYFTTKLDGTGIGLYMCKSIIEKNMGGSMAFRNTDCGAEIRVSVPLAK